MITRADKKMSHRFFVAGTDTDVGKTMATAAVLVAARQRGLSTLALKPVAAGGVETAAGIRNEDALLLARYMTRQVPYEQINPVALKQAVAPHVAARWEGLQLSSSQLARHCRDLFQDDADLILVEGAGGWRVPLNEQEFLSDLARELALPVILVVDLRLGCLSHAVLTAEAIARDGLQLAGWIANQTHPEAMTAEAENLATLRQLLPAPLLGHIPHLPDGSPESAAAWLDLDLLLGPLSTADSSTA